MSRNLTISGSFVSLLFVAAAASAGGCLGEASQDGIDIDSQNSAICAAANWAEGVAYSVGTVVNYGGKSYQCRQAHTSLAGWTPAAVPSLWLETGTCSTSTSGSSGGGTTPPPSGGGSCNYPAWQQGGNYHTGDIVIFNGSPYIAEHDNPGYDPTISTWFWDPYTGCSSSTGGGPTDPPPPSGSGLGSILSQSTFNAMFPNRNPFYTYEGLINAAATFPEFANTGDTATRKREAAAFLANVNHETGGLVYVEEIAKATYCDTSWGPPGCGCAPGKQYYGRGPIQLSWNGNYCAAGNALGLPLMNDPDLLSRDPKAAFRTGFWFWTTQTGAGSMTAHNAIVTGAGFGQTIRTINGALECDGRNPGQVQSRIDAYVRFTGLLGTSPVGPNGC